MGPPRAANVARPLPQALGRFRKARSGRDSPDCDCDCRDKCHPDHYQHSADPVRFLSCHRCQSVRHQFIHCPYQCARPAIVCSCLGRQLIRSSKRFRQPHCRTGHRRWPSSRLGAAFGRYRSGLGIQRVRTGRAAARTHRRYGPSRRVTCTAQRCAPTGPWWFGGIIPMGKPTCRRA